MLKSILKHLAIGLLSVLGMAFVAIPMWVSHQALIDWGLSNAASAILVFVVTIVCMSVGAGICEHRTNRGRV